MVFSQGDLLILGRQQPNNTFSVVNESANLASFGRIQYVFLSHSNEDSELAKGFVNAIRALGISAYIDLYDSTLTLPPSSDTANRLRQRIKQASHFVLLATKHSVQDSRWCPWELGCADGYSIPISIARTKDEDGKEWGAEYLGLYHSLEFLKNSSHKAQLARLGPIVGGATSSRAVRWCNSLML